MRRNIVCFLIGLLFPAALFAQQETGQITGTVTGDAEQPLAGVTVRVEGTPFGGITDADGRYSIPGVPVGTHRVTAVLVGYVPGTAVEVVVSAGQATTVDLALQSEAIALEEIVVVGYGQQQRVNVIGAVGTVSQRQITERPIARITEALQGSTPGLTVIQRSAQPGHQNIQFDIRGRNSINTSTTPLVLIDDVPGDINHINPNDIETISVLKDASSTAIYGSRAANGVVLITTKRGANTGTVQMSYDGYYGIQNVATFPKTLGPREYLELINEAAANRGLPPDYSQEYIENTVRAANGDPGVDPLMYPWTDWLDVLFNPAPIQEHSFGVRGGTDQIRFNASLNYLDHQGMSPQVYADRIAARLNTDVTLTPRWTAGLDLSLRRSTDAEPNEQGDVLFRMFHDTPPTTMDRFPDGTYGRSRNNRNPLLSAEALGRRDRSFLNGTATLRADYQLFDKFAIRSLASVNAGTQDFREWRNEAYFRDFWSGEIWRSITSNRLDHRKLESRDVTLRSMGVYNDFFGDHAVSATLGYEQSAFDNNEIRAIREGSYSNELQEINAGDANRQNTFGTSGASRLRSVFGRVSYSFADRYLLEANVRYDGSSRFAEGNRFGFFPSFSAGWRISEEAFFRNNIAFVDELKVRGSWGRTGNQNITNYEHWQTLELGAACATNQLPFPCQYVFGDQLTTGVAQRDLANPDISWETTTMRNVGVDLVVASGRLAFTGDVYSNLTEGLLLNMFMPRTLGLGNVVRENAGTLENKGWETSLTWRDRAGRVDYSVGFHLYDNKNLVLDLGGNPPQIDGRWLTAEGYSLGTMWGYQADGLFVDQADVDSHADQTGLSPLTGPGDIKFRDLNGDGVITPEGDRTVIGNDLPRYTIGSNLSASYRGFDIGMFFQGVLKADAYIEGALTEGPVWRNFTTVEWLDRWTVDNPNPNAKRPKPAIEQHHNHGPVSSFWVQDVRYLKLKTAQIGYTFRRGAIGQQGALGRLASVVPLFDFNQVRLYVSGQNLLTFSGGLFLDPEFPSGRGTVYPQTRTISVGTSIQF